MTAMSKSKRFGAQTKATATIAQIAESTREPGVGSEMVPMARILRDPNNNRHIPIDWDNPGAPIDDDDPQVELKRDFLEKLEGLARSIASPAGLLCPIVVVRRGSDFVLVAGQRRYLAHKLLGREKIGAIIRHGGPVRLAQLLENTQREDVSLREKLVGLISAISEDGVEFARPSIVEFLKEKVGQSKSMAYLWASILLGPELLRKAIDDGLVTGLREAGSIAALDPSEVADAIANIGRAPGEGEGAAEVSDEGSTTLPAPPAGSANTNERRSRGRPQTHVVVKTKNSHAVRWLAEKVLGADAEGLADVDLNDMKQVQELLKRLFEHAEKQLNEPG